MLEKYQQKLEDNRSAHPLSPEAYHEWRIHPVTVRLFEDLENSVINNALDLAANEDLSLFVGAKGVVQEVLEWQPEEMNGDDDEA